MEEIDDPVLDRLVITLRRAWWLVLLCVLLGGAWFGARGWAKRYVATGSVSYVEQTGMLDAAKLPHDLVSRAVSLKSDIAELGVQGVEEDIRKVVGEKVDVTATLDATDKSAAISVTSSTPGAAEAGLNEYLKVLKGRRLEQARAIVTSIGNSLDAQRAADLARIAELDEQIRPLGPQDVSLSDAYRLERTQRTDELTTLDIERSALDAYLLVADNEVHFVPGNGPAKVGGRLGGVLLGGVLGAVVGIGLLSVSSYFDRRVRSRRDLVRCGLRVLATAARDDNDFAATSLSTCLAAEADVSGSSRFLLARLDNVECESLVVLVQSKLAELVPEASVAVVAAESEAGLVQARTTPQVVFVVGCGRSTEAGIADSSASYSLAGAKIIGGVLIDVPSSFRRSPRP